MRGWEITMERRLEVGSAPQWYHIIAKMSSDVFSQIFLTVVMVNTDLVNLQKRNCEAPFIVKQ